MVKIWELTERCPGYKKDYPEVIPPFVSVWEEKEDPGEEEKKSAERRSRDKGTEGHISSPGISLRGPKTRSSSVTGGGMGVKAGPQRSSD